MVVDKDTKIDEVAAELKKRIDRGEYAAGQRLPSNAKSQKNSMLVERL